MSFAFKEELNELVIFRRCCGAANLCVLTLSRLSILRGLIYCMNPVAQIFLREGGLSPSGPMKSAPLWSLLCRCFVFSATTSQP